VQWSQLSPTFDKHGCDEFGALALSRGLGHADVRDAAADPRTVATTTPRPAKLTRDLVRDPICLVTRGSSDENRTKLAPAFFDQIIRKYEGTRLGRQELEAELLEDTPGALWSHGSIDGRGG